MRQKGAPLPALTSLQIQGDCGGYTFYTRTRGLVVFYPVAPPATPPSPHQIVQKARMRTVAADWRALSAQDRKNWSTMAVKPKTWMSGYNLFVLVEMVEEARQYLPTLQRQSELSSIPPYTPR